MSCVAVPHIVKSGTMIGIFYMVRANECQPGKYHRGSYFSQNITLFIWKSALMRPRKEGIKLSISETPQKASTNEHI